jgi:uncharacterized Zn finger protein
MIPEICPRCGTELVKEIVDFSTSDSNGSGSQKIMPSNCSDAFKGSIDINTNIVTKPTYAYRCPKCGYLYVDW